MFYFTTFKSNLLESSTAFKINLMKNLAELFLSIVFPPKCLVCGRKHGGKTAVLICENCFKSIGINSSFSCPECGKRIYDYKKFCAHEPRFLLLAAVSYKNPAARELIHALKYQRLKTAAGPLAKILKISLEENPWVKTANFNNFLALPIPLHPKKEKARGFNQSLLILKKLSELITLPEIQDNVLIKVRNTNSQIELADYKERTENVSGSFEILEKKKIAGKNILLLDDVFTSGATIKEAARVLKEAGAKKIIGLVVAKA